MQPLLQWKSNEYYATWVCICSLRYQACNAPKPHFHLWPALLYNIFSTSSHKQHDFRTTLRNTHCVFWFSRTTFVWNISPSKKKWARYKYIYIYIYIYIYRSSRKEQFILERLQWNLNFLTFSKNPQVSNFIKIRALVAELFCADRQTDRQTDMTQLVVALRNFANAP